MLNGGIEMIDKNKLAHQVESFIHKNLEKKEYEIFFIESIVLLTWNRLDLAFKLFYLDNKNNNKELAELVYKYDIKAQTLGSYIEYGNEEKKNSFEIYLNSFNKTFENIKNNGFNQTKTLIPLSTKETIINGAHRVASAIFLNEKVTCIETEQDCMVAGYNYFYERGVSLDILDLVVKKFIDYSPNTYIAFLWPSGNKNKEESETKFSNIIYKREIKLTPTGGYNLLIELYRHMDWVGSDANGFSGAKQKLIECFPNFNSFTVIVFQSKSLSDVRGVKEQVRNIHNIGFSSIHITDTKEEAKRISKLIFNENGIHFLNYASPYRYSNLNKELLKFKCFMNDRNIDINNVLIDGSVTLSLYGIRENHDIDILLSDNYQELNSVEYECHDSELKYHGKNKEELIYNHNNYFEYDGLKFTSFEQLFKMKKKRGEKKDLIDCEAMSALLENNKFIKIKIKIKQTLFFYRIKLKRDIRMVLLKFLSITGLHEPVRNLYRKIKGVK